MRKQLSSEDQALNMIAKEAEARLAAKRAARAEARSIRMKELERKQKEIDELEGDEIDTVRRKNSSRLNSPSTTSPLGSDVNIASSVDNAVVKEALKETEDKYKKAMVNVAQLDNERQTLLYQVEILKDIIEDLEEGIHNAKDELHDKTKEFNKLTHEHENVNTQLDKCTYLLSERERILDEHGINFDGTLKETEEDEVDGEREESLTNTHHHNGVHDEELEQKFESERLSYQEKIENLENEIAELRSNQETNGSRKQAESARNGSGDARAADFERSFVDVSSEADAIQEDARHTGLYVNNNEKCDDFEVIDDGSQAGGIRNFEDKSFEKSGRSSLLSSMRTDLVSDSVESELPLEISVDASAGAITKPNKDDYDIVQIDESGRKQSSTRLDVSKLAASTIDDRQPSPTPESNININKYLFSDNDDDNDNEPETAGTFNIDMYFANEEHTTDPTIDQENDDPGDTTLPEIVSPPLPQQTEIEESEDSSSPFLEVKSQATAMNVVVCSEANDDTELNRNDEPTDFHASSQDAEDSIANSQEDLNEAFVSNEEHDLSTGNLEIDSPAVAQQQHQYLQDDSTVVDSQKNLLSTTDPDIRRSVEDLYERILSEDSSSRSGNDVFSDSSEGLPAGATFSEPIGITGSQSTEEGGERVISPVDGTKRKEGWLVRVESFSTPATCTPRIKVIGENNETNEKVDENNSTDAVKVPEGEDPNEGGVDSPAPVPKERKKKNKNKKKKKRKSVELVEDNAAGDTAEDSPFESPKTDTESPAVSPTKRVDHSDIPKQFLDASTTLGAGDLSCSDVSDVEQETLEDGSTIDKKRGGSKKKNKESCKTQ